MAERLLHDTYLPFTSEVLLKHFAPVVGRASDGRHLHYFQDSVDRLATHLAAVENGAPTPSEIRRGRQLEKDERFWIVSALMSLYHRPQGDATPAQNFARLLQPYLKPPADFPDWATALGGSLELYFEVSLPSPNGYRAWLAEHLDQRVLFPYVREAADRTSRSAPAAQVRRLEGATKADALLLAPDTGVAVIFEAKVLSDVSTHVTFDVARNQLARNIDVMLEPGSGVSPLDKRRPELTSFVLVTPDLFRQKGTGLRGSRLYGWLMDQYTDSNKTLLAQHLGHRSKEDLVGVAERIGWVSWEDINNVVPGACSWLDA